MMGLRRGVPAGGFAAAYTEARGPLRLLAALQVNKAPAAALAPQAQRAPEAHDEHQLPAIHLYGLVDILPSLPALLHRGLHPVLQQVSRQQEGKRLANGAAHPHLRSSGGSSRGTKPAAG